MPVYCYFNFKKTVENSDLEWSILRYNSVQDFHDLILYLFLTVFYFLCCIFHTDFSSFSLRAELFSFPLVFLSFYIFRQTYLYCCKSILNWSRKELSCCCLVSTQQHYLLLTKNENDLKGSLEDYFFSRTASINLEDLRV